MIWRAHMTQTTAPAILASRTIAVEHVKISSERSFAEVRRRLEDMLPKLDASMLRGQHAIVAFEKCRGVLAEDIAHFQSGTIHASAFPSGLVCPSSSRRSNGLFVVLRRAGETSVYNAVVRRLRCPSRV